MGHALKWMLLHLLTKASWPPAMCVLLLCFRSMVTRSSTDERAAIHISRVKLCNLGGVRGE